MNSGGAKHAPKRRNGLSDSAASFQIGIVSNDPALAHVRITAENLRAELNPDTVKFRAGIHEHRTLDRL
jgi:hypothetical protein